MTIFMYLCLGMGRNTQVTLPTPIIYLGFIVDCWFVYHLPEYLQLIFN